MARPAGLSSDEEFSDDDLSFGDSPKVQRSFKVQTPTFHNANISKQTQLKNSIVDGNIEQVESLLEDGVGVDGSLTALNGWNALLYAANEGNFKIMKLLLDHGINPNCHYEFYTPLMAVCDSQKCNEEELCACLEMLLEKQADPHMRDWHGMTALMYAVKRNHMPLVMKLLSVKVNVNATDNDGWSALFYAVDSGDTHMVQTLKDTGGDTTLIDKRGRSLSDIALMKDMKNINEMVSVKENMPPPEEFLPKSVHLSSYRFVLSELPDYKKGRTSGFPTEVLKIINGIGLTHLVSLVTEKKVQLGELLTFTDEKWSKLGVNMSFDRAKIRYSVQKFHEHPWGKNCLSNALSRDDISFFTAAQLLSSIVRQMFILSMTSYYLRLSVDPQLAISRKYIENLDIHLTSLKQELSLLRSVTENIKKRDNIAPADLIRPECGKSQLKFYATVTIALGGLAVYTVKSMKSFAMQ